MMLGDLSATGGRPDFRATRGPLRDIPYGTITEEYREVVELYLERLDAQKDRTCLVCGFYECSKEHAEVKVTRVPAEVLDQRMYDLLYPTMKAGGDAELQLGRGGE